MTESTVRELPKLFRREDMEITKLLDELRGLNAAGQIDSLLIVTTSYGHQGQIRKRLGHTATTLVGAVMEAVHVIAGEARHVPIPDNEGG